MTITIEETGHSPFRWVAEQLGHERFTLISTGRGFRIVLDDGAKSDETPTLRRAVEQVKAKLAMSDDSPEPLMKLRDVETELNISRCTLLRWIKDGKLAAVRVGQQWRVRRSVVEEMKGDRA